MQATRTTFAAIEASFTDNDSWDVRLATALAVAEAEAAKPERDEDSLWREDQAAERAMIEGAF